MKNLGRKALALSLTVVMGTSMLLTGCGSGSSDGKDGSVDSPKDFDRFLQCAFYDFSNNFIVINRNKANVLLQVIIYPLLNDNEINRLIKRIIVKNNLSVSYDWLE